MTEPETSLGEGFEKLGLFYLGRQLSQSAIGNQQSASNSQQSVVLYDSSDLVTHGVIVGMTGSGKTGLGIDVIEECAIDGVPVIAIDPKGDLANLLLTFPRLSAEDFLPWIDRDEARRNGQTPEAFAASEAARWAKGLAEWGQDGRRIERLRDAAEFAVYTPGSSAGRPLSIMKSFAAPDPEIVNDPELLQDRVTTAATSVLTLAGVAAEPIKSREHVLIANLFTESWRAGRDLDLASLITQLQAPPFTKVGVLDLESFFPAKDRFALAMRLNQLLAAPGFHAWLDGEALDVDRLLYGLNGRPRVSIISIAHLDDQERMFFVSLLLNEVVGWMRSQRGTSSLRALIYFDEIAGFLPPVANPPSKPPLLTLLKQARAFGLGVVAATQNPVDLDYKALSNAGTWMLGRLQTERDKARVLDGLEGAAGSAGAGFDRAGFDKLLSALGKRQFLLHNVHEQEPVVFETRWALSYLRGPLGRDEIRRLTQMLPNVPSVPEVPEVPKVEFRTRQNPTSGTPGSLGTPGTLGTSGTPGTLVLDPSIDQFFVPNGTHYVPMLLGSARIAYSDAKIGLDESRDVTFVTPIADAAVAVNWDQAEPADLSVNELSKAPPEGGLFSPLPSAAAKAKNYGTWEKDFARWVAQSQSIELFRSKRAKLVSHPDETERDFRIRLNDEVRQKRDEALTATREKYAAKIAAFEDRIRRAEHVVQVQSEQAAGAKMGAAVSVGATLLGALLGRKALGTATLGRATTAARGMGRISKEARDVARAGENAAALRAQRAKLETELQEELRAAADAWDLSHESFERVLVKPKRGGVSVQLVALVWVPA